MMKTWSNWSGSLRFDPAHVAEPSDEEELAALIRRIADGGGKVRIAGAGHSSSPLVRTDGTLVSLRRFQGVTEADPVQCTATCGAGMVIKDLGQALFETGLAMHNTGDVDVQTLAGAVATGTHGTGRLLRNLATLLDGATLVTADGAIREVRGSTDSELLRALRVSLGTAGVLTRLRLKLLPAFRLHRREWCAHVDQCFAHFDELAAANRNFDFYWYPRSDLVKLRTMNEPDMDTQPIPWADCVRDVTGWSHEILPRTRTLRFDEMEYALPAETGLACFAEVRRRVKEKWRHIVAWRVLVRTIAADDALLSPMHLRDTVTISLHQNAGLPFREYFADIEPLFRAHGGRPHWGKKHNLSAHELRPLYPRWDDFQALRRSLDPAGVFLSEDMRALLEENA
jgi:FAD/FMN-containing dehydrogenase